MIRDAHCLTLVYIIHLYLPPMMQESGIISGIFMQLSLPQDLVEDLKGELSGDLEQVVEAVMTPPRLYDVRELKKAMKVRGKWLERITINVAFF